MSHEKSNNPKSVWVDTKIFHKALEFKTVKVRECMIPRTEIKAVDLEDTNFEELNKMFVESGHSKILVFKESIDDVIGYVHSSELFKKPQDIDSIITPIPMVPETLLANELMIQFIAEFKSLALVIDEFGGTSGLVSIEDIIEEIFGEIQDEHDDEDLVEQQLDKYNFILSARHEIDYLNDKYNWNIPLGEYETIGGFILSITGDLPRKDDIIRFSDYSITILSMEDIRIDTLKFSILKDED
jgi:CBS domain containing-hemolysin-like protein